jgi:hypothetical protein
MIKRFYWSLVLVYLLPQLSYSQAITNSDFPIAPIQSGTYQGWTNAFKLHSPALDVVIIPEAGRIVYLAPENEMNIFRLDEGLMGKTPDQIQGANWLNYGGDWFWPVSQARWTDIAGKDWPPPPVLADQPWEGSAWKGCDGSQYCLIKRDYGEPLNIKVSRLIKLEADKAFVSIQQKIERTADSSIPVTLWNISQIAKPDQVVLPIETNSIFSGGLKVLNFDKPTSKMQSTVGNAAVFDATAAGEYKLGSDSERGWIAARRGQALLVERAVNNKSSTPYPDGGCRVECYINSGLGYAEIETLSPEEPLKKGEVLENTLILQFLSLPEKTDAPAITDQIRKLLGEE